MKIEIDLKEIKQVAEEKEDESGEFRHEACRSYPHLHEEKFDSRLMGGLE